MPTQDSSEEYKTYTPHQVGTYLSHINFPVAEYKHILPGVSTAVETLTCLSALQRFHLAAIPFENLSLHYSPARVISLDKDELFEKMIASGSRRGGYCMEQNLLFGTVLRTMNFNVVSTGARVMGDKRFGGWSHQVNLVDINHQVYMVDVGFGGNGPTRPLPLIHEKAFKWGATEAETRLFYENPSNHIVQGNWIFQHRNNPTVKWAPMYCFQMTEFTPADFEVMNYATSTRRTSWFTQKIVCMKMIRDAEKDDIVGAYILNGSTFKKRVQTNSEDLVDCVTEARRVQALKEYFGIELSVREQAAIRGTVTELTG